MNDQGEAELVGDQANFEWSSRPVPIFDGERYLDQGALHTRIESSLFPGKIIRRQGPFRREQGVAEPLRLSQGLFEELAVNYGITVPDFITRIIQHDEAYFGDIIVDRVSGKPLVEVIKEEGMFSVEDLDKLGETFARYYLDKKGNGGAALSDLRVDQFVWGTTEGDPVERAYFVDLDPLYSDYISGGILGQLWRSVKDAEKALGSKLEITRKKILGLTWELDNPDIFLHDVFVEQIRDEILSTS